MMTAFLQSVVALLFIAVGSVTTHANDGGQYIGKLVVEPLDNGRDLKLVKPFAYRDPGGQLWRVPAETVVNGASIPQAAWTFIGGPFSGRYRNASVIHDYFCERKDRPWNQVHKVFYDAMETSGVQPWRRNVMYAAVYQFGPRWEKGIRSVRVCKRRDGNECAEWATAKREELIVKQPKFDPQQFKKMQSLLKAKDMSPQEIERLVDKELRSSTLDKFD
ncbi:MAG: DUF1353 domain-containing protein [Hyphomicrobiaceae bacterium]